MVHQGAWHPNMIYTITYPGIEWTGGSVHQKFTKPVAAVFAKQLQIYMPHRKHVVQSKGAWIAGTGPQSKGQCRPDGSWCCSLSKDPHLAVPARSATRNFCRQDRSRGMAKIFVEKIKFTVMAEPTRDCLSTDKQHI